jgi:hypothetical protein
MNATKRLWWILVAAGVIGAMIHLNTAPGGAGVCDDAGSGPLRE